MGYKIGVPSLKLNNVGNRSKHCGSFSGVAYEGLEERKGLDPDINPEMSKYNVYEGYRTAEELIAYSERHLDELKDKVGRSIRRDAVVMCATIFKPPALYMNSLPIESQQRLLDDCLEFARCTVGKNNIKAAAQHFDEKGAHLHVFWEPITADGRLCAKEMHNIKFFAYVNENLPSYLREQGWDIEDAECYDRAKRECEDKLEEECYQKRKQQGRSSAAYKHEAEKQKQKLLRENEELRTNNSKLIGANGRLEIENADLEDENKQLLQQNEYLQGLHVQLQQHNEKLMQEEEKAIRELKKLSKLTSEIEYCNQVVVNSEELGAIQSGIDEVLCFAEDENLTPSTTRRLLEVFFWIIADLLERLRYGIQQMKVFESLHTKLFGEGKLEAVSGAQEQSLEEKLANAYKRADGISADANHQEKELFDM